MSLAGQTGCGRIDEPSWRTKGEKVKLRYAIIRRANAWILFRGDVELVSFSSLDQASNRARSIAMEMSLENGPVELLVQDAFGELRSEWYEQGALLRAAATPLLRADLGGLHA